MNHLTELAGSSIMVTGGTGSFGKKLVETLLAKARPGRLIIFSRDELKQFEMAQRWSQDEYPCMRYRIGDVRDLYRLSEAMRHVDYVVHAAALKQVPTAEYNPFEAVQTNVMGAQNVIRAAIENQVKKVIALSTDKSAGPINLYGATKLVSDKLFISGNIMSDIHDPGQGPVRMTKFSVVRYGNVVGSRGSVIPFFLQLRGSGELPITHPEMTRFWITLQQGVDFVLQCLSLMQGGELFVPKIPSCKITDLARAIDPDAHLKVIGIRPGEKIHEVMVPKDDAWHTIELDHFYVILPTQTWWKHGSYWRSQDDAKQCKEGFEFSSGTNPWRLTAEELQEMVQEFLQ